MSENPHSNRTVLFLHGFGGSLAQWKPVLARLPDAFLPLVIDLPGHGNSDQTLSESLDNMVKSIATFLETKGGEPVIIAGHSFGGLLAQLLAFRYRHLVSGLILISTAPRVTLHPEFILQLQQGEINPSFIAAGFSETVSDLVKSQVMDDLIRMKIGKTTLFSELELLDFSSFLPSIDQPVLNIYGNEDPVISPRRSKKMAQGLGHAISIGLDGCGHYPHLEDPDKVTSIMLEFFDDFFG